MSRPCTDNLGPVFQSRISQAETLLPIFFNWDGLSTKTLALRYLELDVRSCMFSYKFMRFGVSDVEKNFPNPGLG